MRQAETVPAYEVLYVSDADSFRTVQLHTPVPGRFYRPVEVNEVLLEGVGPWRVDASDPSCPRAVNKNTSKPLNLAIKEGLIVTRKPINLQEPAQKVG